MSGDTKTQKLDSLPKAKTTAKKRVGKVREETEVLPPKNLGGRPTIFSKDLAYEICEKIVEGESLRTILKADNMPGMTTLFRWLDDNEWFRKQYAWSKDNQADTNAEDIQDLAKRVVAGEIDPHAARVAIDAYKWSSAKLKPKKYGDKLDLTSGGEKLPQPILAHAAPTQTDSSNIIEGEVVDPVKELEQDIS